MGNEVWQRGTQQPVQGRRLPKWRRRSRDGFTAKDGGVHDWTTKGALQCTAIDEALFTLQVGQMSPILDSGPTFHIVRVLERKEAGRKPFTDVQGDIRDKLKEQRFQDGSGEVSHAAPQRRPHLDGVHRQRFGRCVAGPQAGRNAAKVRRHFSWPVKLQEVGGCKHLVGYCTFGAATGLSRRQPVTARRYAAEFS